MDASDWIKLLLSGIVSVVVSAVVSSFNIRFNYHELFAHTVSDNRMDWINKFRDEISTVIATIEVKEKSGDMLFKAEKAKASLMTRLNQDITKPGNEYNKRMLEELNKLKFDLVANSGDDDETSVKLLLDLSRKILEPEWKRVKEEAHGKK